MSKISYSRGFPYGAPLVYVRGGATKDPAVKEYLKSKGFQWDGRAFAWTHYMYGDDFGAILKTLRDEYGCEIVPKSGMDSNYILDLETA